MTSGYVLDRRQPRFGDGAFRLSSGSIRGFLGGMHGQEYDIHSALYQLVNINLRTRIDRTRLIARFKRIVHIGMGVDHQGLPVNGGCASRLGLHDRRR